MSSCASLTLSCDPITRECQQYFPDAFIHKRRWGKQLVTKLLSLSDGKGIEHIFTRFKGKTFNEIYSAINHDRAIGIGPLLKYDITMHICRKNGMHDDQRVFINGNGPRRAARLLKLPIYHCAIVNLDYVTIMDVLHAFDAIGHAVSIRNSKLGDDFESYLCKWQKTIA